MQKSKSKHEVILVLVNQGFTDAIIDAARANGAGGGTIIAAKGKGNKVAEKKYGLVIAPEKELLMMLVKSEQKEKIMNAIYKVSGIETKGMAIIFSIPAENVIGLPKPTKTNKKK